MADINTIKNFKLVTRSDDALHLEIEYDGRVSDALKNNVNELLKKLGRVDSGWGTNATGDEFTLSGFRPILDNGRQLHLLGDKTQIFVELINTCVAGYTIQKLEIEKLKCNSQLIEILRRAKEYKYAKENKPDQCQEELDELEEYAKVCVDRLSNVAFYFLILRNISSINMQQGLIDDKLWRDHANIMSSVMETLVAANGNRRDSKLAKRRAAIDKAREALTTSDFSRKDLVIV